MAAQKADEPFSSTLRVRVETAMAERLDALAIKRSKPGALVARSDIAREALAIGVEALERRKG